MHTTRKIVQLSRTNFHAVFWQRPLMKLQTLAAANIDLTMWDEMCMVNCYLRESPAQWNYCCCRVYCPRGIIALKDWTWLITCHVQRLIVDWILVSGSSLCSEMNNTPAFNTDPWCLQALLCCFQMLKLLIHLQSPKVDIKITHKLAYTKNSALQEDLILMSLWYGELSDQNHT